MKTSDLPLPIPSDRLHPRDLLHMIDWLKLAWSQDPTLALTSREFRRCAQHFGLLPQPYRSRTRILLGMLWTEELPPAEVFVRLGAAVSRDWNLERKKAA